MKPYNSYGLSNYLPTPKLEIGDSFTKIIKKKERVFIIEGITYFTGNGIQIPMYHARSGKLNYGYSESILVEEKENYTHPIFGFIGNVKKMDDFYTVWYKHYNGYSGNKFATEQQAQQYLIELHIERMREPLYNIWKHNGSMTFPKVKTDGKFDIDKMVEYAFEQYPNYNLQKVNVIQFAKDFIKNKTL